MASNRVQFTWLGHSTFKVETPGGKTVLIDPWVMGNPACPENLKKFDKIDLMLCTHGHFDHIGDAVELAKKHDPVVVGVYELCGWMQTKGVKQIAPMNVGGSQVVADAIRVTMVPAIHSCGITDGNQTIYGGVACGFVVEFENGLKIYHAGDTAVFGDMRIIHELYAPEIAFLPIGDHFTMGPREAAYACQMLRPKTVVPMHFGTFPLLTGTPAALQKMLDGMGAQLKTMKPGETWG